MQSRSGRSQKIRHNYTKIYGLTGALCVVVALVVAITVSQMGLVGKKVPTGTTSAPLTESPSLPEKSPVASLPESPSLPTETPTPSEEDYGPAILRIPMNEAALMEVNPLTIVDAAHPFDPSRAQNIVNMWAVKEHPYGQGNRLQFPGSNAPLNNEAFLALRELQYVLGAEHENVCLFVQSGYLAVAQDGKLTCECSDKNLSEASHSEHATGYAVDLRFCKKLESGAVGDFRSFQEAPMTATILSNCAKFGWIQSWSAGNALVNNKTNQDQGHFRYVGVPHALYIMEKGLTFDGYMEALRATNYMRPLQVTDSDTKTVYKIYFISAEDALNPAKGVPVPVDSTYDIKGNGVDGFIVTLTEKAAE